MIYASFDRYDNLVSTDPKQEESKSSPIDNIYGNGVYSDEEAVSLYQEAIDKKTDEEIEARFGEFKEEWMDYLNDTLKILVLKPKDELVEFVASGKFYLPNSISTEEASGDSIKINAGDAVEKILRTTKIIDAANSLDGLGDLAAVKPIPSVAIWTLNF